MDAALEHPAAEEGSKLIILIFHLAIGKPASTVIQNLQRKMVEIRFARFELAGQFIAPGMACAADIHGLTPLNHRRRWFRSLRLWILFSPFQVAFEWSMTCLAANPRLGHRGVVGVIGRVVVFEEPRVVAIGAPGVPVHAAPGPMAVFTWL